MKLGFDARIIIERSKRKAVRRRIVIEAAEERGSADAAEASVVIWRGLVVRNQFCALNPSEIGGANACTTAKSCAMSLSTHGAVAVECT